MNEITQTKICTKCKVEQELSCFSKSNRNKCGIVSRCNECARKYYIANKEKISKQKKEYNNSNKEKILNNNKIYYKENREKILLQVNLYQQKNKEKVSIAHKKYRIKNIESITEKKRQYSIENRDKIREYKRIYRSTDKYKISFLNSRHKRRAKIKGGSVLTTELTELKNNAKNCYWCNCSLKKAKVHIDHYMPLSKGGLHTLSNLVVSCDKCNNYKYSKDPFEFANSIGKLL